MREQPEVPPVVAMLGRWLLRLGSVGFGVAIEYKQVYGTVHAQWALVFLGLWFIGVPPALWFDGVWRLARIAAVVDAQPPGGPPTGPVAGPAPTQLDQRRQERRL